jgi:hypothetical protein
MMPMRALCGLVACASLVASGVSLAGDVRAPARELNITAESARGWVPTLAMNEAVQDAAFAYLAARDGGRVEDAYARMTDRQRQTITTAQYATMIRGFNEMAGAVVERRIVKVTWTKDPTNAPAPGLYAAVDLASRFANIDRHCGYIILYQPPEGGDFRVMREEESFMDNAQAQQMERDRSRAVLDQAWAQLSKRCPNYSGLPQSR